MVGSQTGGPSLHRDPCPLCPLLRQRFQPALPPAQARPGPHQRGLASSPAFCSGEPLRREAAATTMDSPGRNPVEMSGIAPWRSKTTTYGHAFLRTKKMPRSFGVVTVKCPTDPEIDSKSGAKASTSLALNQVQSPTSQLYYFCIHVTTSMPSNRSNPRVDR